MDRIWTDEEKERIRRQLEAYCATEPNEVLEQPEDAQWGYQALRPTVVNFERRDVVEVEQAPEWQQAPEWKETPDWQGASEWKKAPEWQEPPQSFSAHPVPEDAPQHNFAENSAPANGHRRQPEAAEAHHTSQFGVAVETAANGGAPASLSASTVAPDIDTQPETHNRSGAHWFGLRGAFGDASAPQEAPAAKEPSHVPVLAVFSLDGGVGKTSLAATLGRILSSRGERVMLMETTPHGLLPFYFGARDRRSGVVRTFRPPAPSTDTPLQIISDESRALLPDSPEKPQFPAEIAPYAYGASRVIVDLPTAGVATARRLLPMSPIILVPMIPDMKSLLSAGAIESALRPDGEASAKSAKIYYVLNQFEPSLPLHQDVREALRKRLGDRLLPFELRRASVVSEGLAEGMTVLDYAPDSQIMGDFSLLCEWLKAVAAPANVSTNGPRWSEAS